MFFSRWTFWACLALLSASGCGTDDGAGEAPKDTGLGSNGLKLSGMGDSIMQGFDAKPCGTPICFDQPEYSFAQGTSSEVESLYLRFGEPGKEFASVTGAAMVNGANNAKSQANRICHQEVRPNRIVILLGANDICNADALSTLPSALDFSNALNDALTLLASESCALARGSAIHVVSVPRVDLLQASGLAKTDVACSEIWHSYGICALATEAPSAETLQTIASTVDSYNRAIAATVAELKSTTDPARELTFTTDYVGAAPNTSFGTYAFVPADLSNLDCFHPSLQGQRKLACMAWESWQGSLDLSGCL